MSSVPPTIIYDQITRISESFFHKGRPIWFLGGGGSGFFLEKKTPKNLEFYKKTKKIWHVKKKKPP